MKITTRTIQKSAAMALAVGFIFLSNIALVGAQETKANEPSANATDNKGQESQKPQEGESKKAETEEQVKARKEILSLCEKLASGDTSKLQPFYTEEAFKIQCGEWIMAAVEMSEVDGFPDELKAIADLKKYVQENKLDTLELDEVFEDDQSMFGGKVLIKAYEALPAESRLEIALQCGTRVNAFMNQLREMDFEATEEGGDESDEEQIGPLEMFLGGRVQEIVWGENRATIRSVVPLDEISDEELEQMGFKREELTESPYPENFLKFVKVDGKWLFDGKDAEKCSASYEKTFGSWEESELSMPLIENLALKGESVSDKQIDLADYKGKVVLIDFWGTWCGPCVASLPKLKSLHEEFHKQGLEIIGVAADEKEDLQAFLEKKELPWDHILDPDGKLAEKLGVNAYPTLLLVDRKGNNVKNFVGETAELKKIIGLLIEGKSLTELDDQSDADSKKEDKDK